MFSAESEAELQLNIAGQEQFELPSVDDVEKELKEAPNLQVIKDRIRDVIQVLSFSFFATVRLRFLVILKLVGNLEEAEKIICQF